jgi:hypothetical protein
MKKRACLGMLPVLAVVMLSSPVLARDYYIDISGTATGGFDPDENGDIPFADATFDTTLVLTVPRPGATITTAGGTTEITGTGQTAVPVLFTQINFNSSQLFGDPPFQFGLSDPDGADIIGSLDEGTPFATLSRSANTLSIVLGRDDILPSYDLTLSITGSGNVFGSSNLTAPFSYADPAGIGTGHYADGEPHGFGMFADLTITSISLRAASAAPEPASWAMMIGGLGVIGGALRRRSDRIRFA